MLIRGLTARSMDALTGYAWSGNVRQLENWIENAAILVDEDRIDLAHFPALGLRSPAPAAGALPTDLALPELERLYIMDTLGRKGATGPGLRHQPPAWARSTERGRPRTGPPRGGEILTC